MTLNGEPLKGRIELQSDRDATPSVIGFDESKGALSVIERGNSSYQVLKRAFDYWACVDETIARRIEKAVRDKIGGKSQSEGMMSAQSITAREDVPMPSALSPLREAAE